MRYDPVLKQTLRALLRDYGTTGLTISKYVIGAVDFKLATTNNTVDTIKVSGIALPKMLNVAFIPKSMFTIDRKSRYFVIVSRNCTPDWVKEGNFLTYSGERYNIKKSELVENAYYAIEATATGDEIDDS